jgi:hypothetical protein
MIKLGSSVSNIVRAGRVGRLSSLSIYRFTVRSGFRSPLQLLADVSDEFAETVHYVQEGYSSFLKWRTNKSRLATLEGIETLADSLRGPEVAATLDRGNRELVGFELFSRWKVLQGAGGADSGAQPLTKKIGFKRSLEYFERVAKTTDAGRRYEIAGRVQRLIASIAGKAAPSASEKALLLYLETVDALDMEAWKPIYDKLERLRKARSKAFLEQLVPEKNILKGLLFERWVYKSRPWQRLEAKLWREAEQRAYQMSTATVEWRPAIVREPLLDVRWGREIFDGGLFLVSPGTKEHTFDALLHATVQMKASKRVKAIPQESKDIARVLGGLGGFPLRTRDHLESFRVLPTDDPRYPKRIVFAPQVPTADELATIPGGVEVMFEASRINADQMGGVADLLVREVVDQ